MKRIASCKFGSKDYWSLCKSVLNNSKPTIPPLFNQFEVLTSSADKAECFAWKFSSASMLNSFSVPIPDFSPKTVALLSELHITPLMVLVIVFKLDSHKASSGNGIPAIVLKKCASELAPVLSKLYN